MPEQWISHFFRDGTQGTSWIDHLLVKGSASITPTYLGIDHSGFWLHLSDHRPVILGLTAPAFRRLHCPSSIPRGSLQFPRHGVQPDFYSVSNFQHKLRENVLPDLPHNPTLEDCQLAYTNILGASLKSLPKRKKRSVRNPHKDGWSPMMAGLKAKRKCLDAYSGI